MFSYPIQKRLLLRLLPVEPVITRLGTWFDSCVYYGNYSKPVKSVVDSLKAEDTKPIQSAQELFSVTKLQGWLAYIKSNLGSLSEVITRLQEKGVTLQCSLD